MKPPLVRLCITVLACLSLAGPSQAQSLWKWRDAKGQLQVSDRPPPMDVPESAVIQRPANTRLMARPAELPPSAAPSAPSAPQQRDSELEARKRKLQQEQDARKKSEQEQAQARTQAQRAEFCSRTRNSLAAIDSGQRIARFNGKGEREVLDDAGRAEEAARLRRDLAEHCQQP